MSEVDNTQRAQRILAVEQARIDALIANDTEALATFLHPQLVYTHSNAVVDTGDVWLRTLETGAVRYPNVQRDEVNVTIHDSTALLTGTATFDVVVPERAFSFTARFTGVWVDIDTDPKLLAWQNTIIP